MQKTKYIETKYIGSIKKIRQHRTIFVRYCLSVSDYAVLPLLSFPQLNLAKIKQHISYMVH